MRKKELYIIIGIAVVALVGLFGYRAYTQATYAPQATPQASSNTTSNPSTNNTNTDVWVDVTHQSEVIYRFQPNEDQTYTFQGSYGSMTLEVADGKWRITNEDCPNHICSSIGWVGVDDYFPIVCIPNEVYVTLE